jgi:hypothetical protein
VKYNFRLLLGEPDVQGAILAAVRKVIRDHFAYAPESVPFELLQNADDATVELGELGGVVPGWFAVSLEEGRLAFLHAGRAINQAGLGGTSISGRGFERDLEKMLILSSSDKPFAVEDGALTGKFGLGFKSVFLVADSPCVLSGATGFRVLGGLFPQELSPQEEAGLQARYQQAHGRALESTNGTIVKLDLLPGIAPRRRAHPASPRRAGPGAVKGGFVPGGGRGGCRSRRYAFCIRLAFPGRAGRRGAPPSSQPRRAEAVMEPTTEQPQGAADLAMARLLRSPYRAMRGVRCEERDGVLTLSGVVHSYHLKQVAQAAVSAVAPGRVVTPFKVVGHASVAA